MQKTKMNPLQKCLLERQNYAASCGGYFAIHEADDTFNNINARIVHGILQQYGKAYMGQINYYGQQRQDVVDGKRSVFEEYTGQRLFTDCCDFCVPEQDEKLEKMIRAWNRCSNGRRVDAILNRIHALHGEYIFWS